MSERLTHALALAEHGFGVFPVWGARDGVCRCPRGAECVSPGKHPITTDGFKSATTDPERIRTFMTNGHNYGVVPPENVFVLDVDGPDVARFDRLAGDYGTLPDTYTVSTANGKHVYLTWPAGVARPEHRMFGLVTRWGSGPVAGYVLGPGSVHQSGHVYTATGTLPPATLPARWLEGAAVKPVTFTIPGAPDELPQRGGRHEWLRDRARHFAGVIRDDKTLFAAVWAENLRLDEPKNEDEVRQAIGDVLEKYAADPEAKWDVALNYHNGAIRDVVGGKTIELWMPEVYEKRGEPVGELTVTVDGVTVQKSTEPLSNAVKADRLAVAMERLVPGIHWPSVLTSFYLRRLDDYNKREPLATLGEFEPVLMDPVYVLRPLVFDGATTIVFAKEGTGKSTLAAAVALSVASGTPVFPDWTVPVARPVLVLDWEATEADWQRIVWGLRLGSDIEPVVPIHYQKMTQPLTKDLPGIARTVSKGNVGLVVIDSAMMASPQSNGEAADSALALFHGLRELGASVLLIDHLNKQTPSGDGARPYGSVYKPALARSTWELAERPPAAVAEVQFGTQYLVLHNRKANLAPRVDPIDFRLERMGHAIRLVPDQAVYTKDDQYHTVVAGLVKWGDSDSARLASRVQMKREVVDGILEHFPEFVYAGGKWAYVAEPATCGNED